MIELLKPLFRGELAALGETLVCGDPAAPGLQPLAALLASPAALDALLARHAAFRRCDDLRPVASAWMLDYAGVLLPAVVAGASVLQHLFPVAAGSVALQLDGHARVRAVVIPTLGHAAPGQDSASRYGPLLDGHLAPLIARLSERARLPEKLLWGSVSRWLEPILEQAAAAASGLPPLAALVAADHAYLLEQEKWPDGRCNPLFGRRKHAAPQGGQPGGHDKPMLLHRQCCLYYRLPGESHCGACPLSPALRRARGAALRDAA